MLWKGVEPEYQPRDRRDHAGLAAKGVKADRWDLLGARQRAEELPYYYVPWLDKKEGKGAVTHAPGNCSAFVATGKATRDGRIVMGHNAWTNYVVGSRWNIVFEIVPERGARILMDGLPGIITSDDDFGVTSFGLMITETTITQFEGWDPEGKPEFSRARKAMQYARSIDEYVAIMLDGNNGGYANDWLLGDTKTGEIARFELGLKHHSVERTKDGYFVGSNFPVGAKLIAEETKFDVNNKSSSPNARRTRWEQLMKEWSGRIDVEAGKRFELDTFDPVDGKDGANDRTIFGAVENCPRGIPEWDWGPYYPGGTVQSKVADASMAERLEFWGAMGHPVGPPFVADAWLKQHPEHEWMRGLLKDVGPNPWSRFTSDPR
ncbi:MAG: C45 family autoproteolytic acyltransferase/hydrolase [Isosphaeraceae bacterium]